MRRGTKKYSLEELYHIATLYHREKQTQDAIAKAVGKTRQEVAAMLREAEEKRLVYVTLSAPDSMRPSNTFGEKLQRRFPNLVALSILYDPPTPASSDSVHIDRINFFEIASMLWEMVIDRVQLPITIAIGSNRIIRDTLAELSPWIAPRIPLDVVPMVGYEYAVGFTAESNADYFFHLQMQNSRSGHTELYPFPAPAILSLEQRECLANAPMIEEALGVYSTKVNVVIANIRRRGSKLNTIYPDGSYDSPIEAVGDLSGYLFGDQGVLLDDQFQPFGIGVARLCELAASQEALVVGLSLTAGHEHKSAQATLAALEGGLVNALIMDVRIAKSLEDLLDDTPVGKQ